MLELLVASKTIQKIKQVGPNMSELDRNRGTPLIFRRSPIQGINMLLEMGILHTSVPLCLNWF